MLLAGLDALGQLMAQPQRGRAATGDPPCPESGPAASGCNGWPSSARKAAARAALTWPSAAAPSAASRGRMRPASASARARRSASHCPAFSSAPSWFLSVARLFSSPAECCAYQARRATPPDSSSASSTAAAASSSGRRRALRLQPRRQRLPPAQDRFARPEPLQVLGERQGRPVTAGRVLRQTFETDCFQIAGRPRPQPRRRRRVGGLHLLQQFAHARPRERRPPRQQLIKDDAERVHVHGGAGLARPARGLFGRHVGGRAHDGPGSGFAVVLVEVFGQAEVGDLRLAVGRQQDVGRFQVAVDDAALVGVLHRAGQFLHELGGLRRTPRRPVPLAGEAAALHVLQRNERPALVFSYFVDLHNVRMVEPGDGLAFRPEARPLLVQGVLGRQDHFQGHDAPQRQVAGLVHHAHAAAAELVQHLIAGDLNGRRRLRRALPSARRRGKPLPRGRGQDGEGPVKDVGVLGQARPVVRDGGMLAAAGAVFQVQRQQLAEQGGPVGRIDQRQEVLDPRRPAGLPLGLETVARRVDSQRRRGVRRVSSEALVHGGVLSLLADAHRQVGDLRVCPISPSPPYSGERGWGEGACYPRPKSPTPTPSPPEYRGEGRGLWDSHLATDSFFDGSSALAIILHRRVEFSHQPEARARRRTGPLARASGWCEDPTCRGNICPLQSPRRGITNH